MSVHISKVDVAIKITELLDEGKHEEAMKLQKIFISSIKRDQINGQYSGTIVLDRTSKKIIKAFDFPTLTSRAIGFS
ncbi:hypothetical protein [Methylomagnum sp.]